MGHTRSNRSARRVLLGLVGLSAMLLTACDPGLTNPWAGTGEDGSSGDGAAAVDASFRQPGAIAYDATTDAYLVVDDAACVVRRVAADGTVSTVVGDGICGYSGDGGRATEAQIDPRNPLGGSDAATGGIATDPSGNIYLADSGNGRIRVITPDGVITTSTDDFDTSADVVGQVAVTTTGSLFASASESGLVRVDVDGATTQAIGCDCDDPARHFRGIVGDPTGGLLVSDADGRVAHLDEVTMTLTTRATLPSATWGDVLGVDRHGAVYATGEHRVARVDADGAVTTIAGNGAADPGTDAQHGSAGSMALTPMGLAATVNNGLLVSSGHVVYRIDRPASIVESTEACDTERFHPGADLQGQDLSDADFTGCDLSGANLEFADLSGANLSGADLSGADLSSVTLTGATVEGAHLDAEYLPSIVTGGLVGTPAALPDGWTLVDGTLVPPTP